MTGRLRRALSGRRSPPSRDRDGGNAGAGIADETPGERLAEPDGSSLAQRMTPSWCVGRVAGDVAHELNNHLQIVLGGAELLGSMDGLPGDARRRLARVVEAGRRAAAVNGSLLALAREVGTSPARVTGEPPDIAFGDTLGSRTERLTRLAGSGTTFATALDPHVRALPIARLRGRDVLPELLDCLVVHAAAAHADGAAAVTLHARLAGPGSTTLELYVDVDGAGAGDSPRNAPRRSESSGSDGAAAVEKPSLVADVLASLAERAGGRLRQDAPPPAHGGIAAVLSLEPGTGSP